MPNRTRLQTESVLDLFQNPFITMPLSSVSHGARVTLQTLPAHPVLVQRLRALGVQPGAEIEVVRRGKSGGILHLACGFLEFMLRHEHAQEMEVGPA